MEKKTPTREEMVRMRVVLRVPGMDEVQVRRDLVYRTVAGEALHMDVYSPAETTRPRPAVVLAHGGPIPRTGAKDMGVFVSYGELLAASGLIAVTFDHRFLAPERLADARDDVAAAVEHVRSESGTLAVDPERLALWVFSGGGPLLAAPLRDRPPWLRALVAYYAPLDVREVPAGVDDTLGPERRREFSAATSLGDGHGAPPLLVARAGLDHPWINGGIDRFVQEALAKGATLDLLTHPDGRHGFDILDDDARSRQIIQRTIGFLRDSLLP